MLSRLRNSFNCGCRYLSIRISPLSDILVG